MNVKKIINIFFSGFLIRIYDLELFGSLSCQRLIDIY